MASKRKSTTPCMIPSKIIRPAEEIEPDPPVLLCPSKTSGGGRHSPLDPGESSKLEVGDAVKDGAGTYTCKPCNFETHDLNLFLDHVYSGHPDFRADPSFFCVSCGVSAPKFEGLALHNARVHPSTLSTSLQLRKKDRRVVVEQNLGTGAETGKDSEISITKTPIMRMLKGKSEPKRIVVSHPVSDEPSTDPLSTSASRESERKETAAVTVTHVPTIVHNGTTKVTMPPAIQIVNGSGALSMLKTPITQVGGGSVCLLGLFFRKVCFDLTQNFFILILLVIFLSVFIFLRFSISIGSLSRSEQKPSSICTDHSLLKYFLHFLVFFLQKSPQGNFLAVFCFLFFFLFPSVKKLIGYQMM